MSATPTSSPPANKTGTTTDNSANTGGLINRLVPNYSNEEYNSDEDLGEDLIDYGKPISIFYLFAHSY